MHPDIMQAIVRDRSSRMRDQAESARLRTASRRSRRGEKAEAGSGGRTSGRSG